MLGVKSITSGQKLSPVFKIAKSCNPMTIEINNIDTELPQIYNKEDTDALVHKIIVFSILSSLVPALGSEPQF